MTQEACAVISGAGGEIGRAIASRFARDGRHIVLIDREVSNLGPLSAELIDSGAKDVLILAADQTNLDAINLAVNEIVDRIGVIGTFVANAGFARFGGFLDTSPKVWDLHVDINLNGTFHMCQAIARNMITHGMGGSITLISSCLALFHADQTGAYSATKAALLMLTKSMAAELGVYGIRANSVLPGVVETAMTRPMLSVEGCREALLQETPIGRLGRPEDVAEAVAFLAGPHAGFITGASLLVDGGQSIYGQPQWFRQDRSKPGQPRWLSTATNSPVESTHLKSV
ncbi:SDR family NAD(P)-dependent oxidoreductase [Pararhizobium sp. LjRoot255]|uniref:SDR family NAD(P)-dependent oxidoreductase n=1 Tax=Pararhizobium sp. LjRoot255 TaxID=3342298 RepID=UPI003ECCFEA0